MSTPDNISTPGFDIVTSLIALQRDRREQHFASDAFSDFVCDRHIMRQTEAAARIYLLGIQTNLFQVFISGAQNGTAHLVGSGEITAAPKPLITGGYK